MERGLGSHMYKDNGHTYLLEVAAAHLLLPLAVLSDRTDLAFSKAR